MAYDFPYRLEHHVTYSQSGYSTIDVYTVVKTGEGKICEGSNFHHIRKLVDAANEAFLQDSGHRGR